MQYWHLSVTEYLHGSHQSVEKILLNTNVSQSAPPVVRLFSMTTCGAECSQWNLNTLVANWAKKMHRLAQKKTCFLQKLEYLAVYGCASMAAFRQLSTHIMPPRSNVREAWLNTHGQKFDPESLYEPI